MNDLTAWEDINPTTVSVQRQEQQSQSSDVSREVFRNELTACLALVAPVGMTEEAKRDWLVTAWDTLKDIPPDILRIGTAAARKTCDHPSKIVPTIIAETAQPMKWRRELNNGAQLKIAGPVKPRPLMERRGEAMTQDETDELNKILENLGATARYRADGSRYLIS
jgi:hypothetical protein